MTAADRILAALAALDADARAIWDDAFPDPSAEVQIRALKDGLRAALRSGDMDAMRRAARDAARHGSARVRAALGSGEKSTEPPQ